MIQLFKRLFKRSQTSPVPEIPLETHADNFLATNDIFENAKLRALAQDSLSWDLVPVSVRMMRHAMPALQKLQEEYHPKRLLLDLPVTFDFQSNHMIMKVGGSGMRAVTVLLMAHDSRNWSVNIDTYSSKFHIEKPRLSTKDFTEALAQVISLLHMLENYDNN